MVIVGLLVRGDSGETYTIETDASGEVTCTCPAFRFAGESGFAPGCKHIRFATDRMLALAGGAGR